MDPLTIMTIVSAGLNMAGRNIEANAAKAEAAFNSQIAKVNRQLAIESGLQALIKGQQKESIRKYDTRQLVSAQTAAFGASGVVVNEGTAADVIATSELMGELDAAIIRDNAEKEKRAYDLQAEGYRLEGKLAKARGDYASQASMIGGVKDLFKIFG